MRTKLLMVLLTAIALAVGFAVRATREVMQTKSAICTLSSQSARLHEAAATVERRLRTANDALAKGQGIRKRSGEAGAGVGANEATSGNEAAAKLGPPARRLLPTTIIANDMKKMLEYERNFRASLDFTDGAMFKALGFSADQIEKWKDLRMLVEQQRIDLIAAVQEQGLDGHSEIYQAMKADNERIRQEKEAEVLGDLEPAYREYERTQSVRLIAQKLIAPGVYSSQPVTPDQIERTTQILAATSQRTQTGAQRGWVKWNTINWDAASTQLQAVLPPVQVWTLGIFVQENAAMRMVDDQMNRLNGSYKGATP